MKLKRSYHSCSMLPSVHDDAGADRALCIIRVEIGRCSLLAHSGTCKKMCQCTWGIAVFIYSVCRSLERSEIFLQVQTLSKLSDIAWSWEIGSRPCPFLSLVKVMTDFVPYPRKRFALCTNIVQKFFNLKPITHFRTQVYGMLKLIVVGIHILSLFKLLKISNQYCFSHVFIINHLFSFVSVLYEKLIRQRIRPLTVKECLTSSRFINWTPW